MTELIKQETAVTTTDTLSSYTSTARKVYPKCENDPPLGSISSEDSSQVTKQTPNEESIEKDTPGKSLEETIGETIRYVLVHITRIPLRYLY